MTVEINCCLDQAERSLVQSCIGKTLTNLQGVMLGDTAWHTVRVETDGPAFDITCLQTSQPIDDRGGSDEYGVMHIDGAQPGSLEVPDIAGDAEQRTIGQTIDAIYIANDEIATFSHSSLICNRKSTQAVIFKLANGIYLAIDRGVWFSEMLTISEGASIERLLYDGSQDWEDDPLEDPDTHYEFRSWIEAV